MVEYLERGARISYQTYNNVTPRSLPSECPNLEDPLCACRLHEQIQELALGSRDFDVGKTLLMTVLQSGSEGGIFREEEGVVIRVGTLPVLDRCRDQVPGSSSRLGGGHYCCVRY